MPVMIKLSLADSERRAAEKSGPRSSENNYWPLALLFLSRSPIIAGVDEVSWRWSQCARNRLPNCYICRERMFSVSAYDLIAFRKGFCTDISRYKKYKSRSETIRSTNSSRHDRGPAHSSSQIADCRLIVCVLGCRFSPRQTADCH